MLKGIVRGKKHPPRVVLYGPPKIGKSTWGADAPHPVFVTTEQGVDNLPVDQYPVPADWPAFVKNIKAVATEEHDYKTIIIDTLNGASELCAKYVCDTQFKGQWGPKGFGAFMQGWASTSETMREILPLLDQCRKRGMTVVLLAHTGVQNVKNPVDGDYQRFVPDLDKRVWSRFAAWADVILRADYEYSVVERSGKKEVIGSNTRVLHASGSPREDAGTRVGYSLPETIPLSYTAFAEELGQDKSAALVVTKNWDLLDTDQKMKSLKYMKIKDISAIESASLQAVAVVANRIKQIKQS